MNTGLYIMMAILIVLIVVTICLVIYLLNKNKSNNQIKDNSQDNEILKQTIDNNKELTNQKIENVKEAILKLEASFLNSNNITTENDKQFSIKLENIKNLANELKTLDKDQKDFSFNHDKNINEKLNNKFNDVQTGLSNLRATTDESKLNLKDIMDKVNNLNEIFSNNSKQRGNIGEYLLNKLLDNIYGHSNDLWQAQYKLADNNIVDAVVKTESNQEDIIIDSKFSLTNYENYLNATDTFSEDKYLKEFKNDIKKRVDEVAKYISKKNNISSGIMFIPSESMFNFIVSRYQNDVVDYAMKKKVWIVSPTSLAALLSIIDKQNSDIRLDKNLEKIKADLLILKTDFNRFSIRWQDVVKANNKMTEQIDKLSTTTNKIENKYSSIYSQAELDEIE